MRALLFALALLGFAGSAHAQEKFMPLVSGPAGVPAPWAELCKKDPGQCAVSDAGQIALTSSRLAELEIVNATVNGRKDLAERTNPCFWQAVEKRRMLLAKGWPAGALLLTDVVGPLGPHEVLTVKTAGGDYILDSYLHQYKVILWSEATEYRFLSRQYGTKDGWVKVKDDRSQLVKK